MKYNQALHIPSRELSELEIPTSITEAQLENSGYTYRFSKHKEILKKSMADSILANIEFEFRITPEGVVLIGKVEL